MRLYRFIDSQKAVYPIRVLCQILCVPESSYFDWHDHGRDLKTARDEADAVLVDRIRSVHAESDSTYGAPRIQDELSDGGVVVSKRRVARLMREHDIQGLSGREHATRTTRRDRMSADIPDLVNRDFQPETPDEIWYGDITYIWINNKFWFLATVIDACTKEVLGWKFDDNMEASLVEDALKAAVARRGKNCGGTIFHTDRGSQYTSEDFGGLCKLFGIKQSMGRRGVCYDNAAAESFFSTIKRELINRYYWDNPDELHTEIFAWIETWYNQKRKHTSIGMKTPNQTYAKLAAAKAA